MDEQVVKDIVKTRNIIRKKYEKLKMGQQDETQHFEQIFQPITTPLKKLVDIPTALAVKPETKPETIMEADDFATPPKKRFKFLTPPTTSTPLKPAISSTNDEEDFTVSDNSLAMVPHSQMEMESPRIHMINSTNKFMDSLNIKQTDFDYRYGPYYKYTENVWKIGSLPFTISNNNIFINDQVYNLTPGLINLIFLKRPQLEICEENDISVYLEIIVASGVLYRNFDKAEQKAGNKGYKYKFINKLLNKQNKSHVGTGLMQYSTNKMDYVYWDNPNELVDRLRLLLASQQAGHTNHNNEILAILEELKEAKIIL